MKPKSITRTLSLFIALFLLLTFVACSSVDGEEDLPSNSDFTINPSISDTVSDEENLVNLYSGYEKDFEVFQKEMEIPPAYFEIPEVVAFLKKMIDNSNDNRPLQFIIEDDIAMTSDLKLCYYIDNGNLQFIDYENGLNVKKKITVYPHNCTEWCSTKDYTQRAKY